MRGFGKSNRLAVTCVTGAVALVLAPSALADVAPADQVADAAPAPAQTAAPQPAGGDATTATPDRGGPGDEAWLYNCQDLPPIMRMNMPRACAQG